ncbi:hypothetical protein [Fusobacterium perfoetens]|uniref:hypothetical protein n=1 Tax=Fusobacterium perfoetens TaxID=852 RepID=UPI001F240F70|nr:hypothetical protein [Fusobacterium perfoetens]MCF2611753.1 hypothetical protein [Fusobacterium perfoetens]
MLENKEVSTLRVLDLLFKTAEEINEDPKEVFEKVCKKCSFTIPKITVIKLISEKDFGGIKKGNELIFDVFKRKLENNKIYVFTYKRENIYYEDYGRYNSEDNSLIVDNEVKFKLNGYFNILGQLTEISGNL